MSLNWSASVFELVAGLDRDALAQIAGADARRARPQRLDRHHHAAGQEHAGHHRERETEEQQQRRAPDRFEQRLVGLAARQFDEDDPPGRRDRSIGGQHLAALDVLGFLHRLLDRAGDCRPCSLHLGQLGHVGVAQHQADVGVRDQPALRVDHIGMTALADLDLRDHLPDQLEIDFGDAHAGIAARTGERQRHVGLGFAPEIDRAVVDLLGDRLGELRVLRVVGLARHHVHRKPRHPQLLLALGIELGKLRDRRHLPQQAQTVEPAGLDGAGRPGQLGGPADLALDALDELVDFLGGGRCLLALNADERGLVLLVGEPDFECAVGDQRDAHDGDEQRDVFPEQRAADRSPIDPVREAPEEIAGRRLHPLTSRTQRGMGKPRALSRATGTPIKGHRFTGCGGHRNTHRASASLSRLPARSSARRPGPSTRR